MPFTCDDLLAYTDWEREQWQHWFDEQGPAALAVDLGPNRDGRINTVGELVRHIFSAELRYTERCREVALTDTSTIPVDDVQALFAFGQRSRQAMRELLATFPEAEWDAPREMKFGSNAWMVSSRKMVIQALTHEIRHWAQMATLLRLAGFKPGPRDYIASPLLPPRS
jgi:uncharacterized damage-inducible protein DinB